MATIVPELDDFAEDSKLLDLLLAQIKDAPNRRTEERRAMFTTVSLQPLDDDLVPIGEPFFAMIRNISVGGIGLMFAKETECKYLQLKVETPAGEHLKTVIEIKHCTANGIMIGCSEISDLKLW